MSTVQNSTASAAASTSFAADAVAKAGQIRKDIAGVSMGFNFGDALAAAAYVVLGCYGFVFVANAAFGA
ncbi:MAG TPA: hypothetical protein VGN05_02270 [Parvibaculum sp.]|jgi:hypothetical protein